ncbi:hypothetical protein BRARA_J00685 [Brassica rapa]|uniref:Uncharacterized protein n=1 Tax=Brassica campestris TaxID=3711 RepID=A0A397XRN0_BRACM|nr:hypothetical protein BRARA_J00685 [Brassica rapa]
MPSKCWCGVGITELISKTNQSPYHSYYRCIYAVSLRVHPLSFKRQSRLKWVDEAFTDEIQQLDYQVRMLEEEENTSTDMLLNVTRAPLLKELAKKEKINIRQIHENIN